MKKLIDFTFSIVKLLGGVCLIVMLATFIIAMICGIYEIIKDNYESKRISATNSKDRI